MFPLAENNQRILHFCPALRGIRAHCAVRHNESAFYGGVIRQQAEHLQCRQGLIDVSQELLFGDLGITGWSLRLRRFRPHEKPSTWRGYAP